MKRKIKVNFIDILILVVVLIALALLTYIFVLNKAEEDKEHDLVTVKYVVEVSQVKDEFVNFIKKGAEVYNNTGKKKLGTIEACEVREATYIGKDQENGKLVLSIVEGYKNVYVTIEAQAYLDDYRYVIEGMDIYVGAYINMLMPDISCGGYCFSFEVLE